MKPNELRIGNFVYWDDLPHKVAQINNHGEVEVFPINQIEECWYLTGTNYLSPIPITEDFLRDIGFDIEVDEDEDGICIVSTKGRRGDFYSDVVLYSSDDVEDYGCDIRGIFGDLFRVKYVHQLQNLYFALTGEEL